MTRNDASDITPPPNAEDLKTAEVEKATVQATNSGNATVGHSLGGSDVPGFEGEQVIPDTGVVQSNLAVTAQARALVVDNQLTHTVETGRELNTEADLFGAITDASGSTNIKWGKSYTAIRSTTFQAPSGSGTRAGVITKDGTVTVLPSGVNYDIWYAEMTKLRGYGLVFRFDQREDGTNPYMQVDVYKRADLPVGKPMKDMDWD